MFYEIFAELCRRKGVSPSFVVQEIGLSKPNAVYWKRGSIPKGDTLQKLADYFGVSVDYLLCKDSSPYSNVGVTIRAAEGDLAVGGEELLEALKDMTADELEDVQKFAQFILSKRKGPCKPSEPPTASSGDTDTPAAGTPTEDE